MKIKTFKKTLFGTAAVILSGTMLLSVALPAWKAPDAVSAEAGESKGRITDITGSVDPDTQRYLDMTVNEKLPESVSSEEEISILVYSETDTVLGAYDALGKTDMTLGEFASSNEGKAVTARIEKQNKVLQNKLKNAGVRFTVGYTYDTLIGGFEAIIKAKDFDKLAGTVGDDATVMVSEVYAECETQVVTNEVDVYNTGIFDSSDSQYKGSGMLVAVVDTGLDYTHPAFDPENFGGEEVLKVSDIQKNLSRLTAKRSSPNATAQDLYQNVKVPYTYDYADKSPNVFPINSEHGTHVAGVMVGKDETITGVAPDAQLAVMKVFSEHQTGAKQSWITAALEDCVILGVDVINMSLGSSSGFSREVDEIERQRVYDAIKERGISLVAAASNDYNSTFGSEKNGNLGLTSNPDSATVGAPSTYPAALSVASISGVKTPYLLFNGEVIYFKEASDRASEPLDFVEMLLKDYPGSQTSYTFEYVPIPGVGSESDYADYDSDYLGGKIALVERGTTNFEEKARIAQRHGAAGCIIYNNVSGDISMTIGEVRDFPVCSVSQDDGQKLLAATPENRKIGVSRSQEAGPFMSDFSSWGPTPDLGIKPEITAHGGEILSAIPGGGYDRLSGTSMASPNQAGVTTLVRQYVKNKLALTQDDDGTRRDLTDIVNELMMSTADIAYNTNGLPFSVRKQGAGLANLTKATTSPAYIEGFDRYDPAKTVGKAKIEAGDDPKKEGVYRLRFNIVNMENATLTYDVSAIVMTEGVSETLTVKGARTVTEKGYILDGAEIAVTEVSGGSQDGSKVTVGGNKTATVTVTVTLGEKDKSYLDASFANGMYVEGFVTLTPAAGTEVALNVPYLAFYGDWTQAPLFDIDYFETSKSEIDESIDFKDKTMPDAYATRPLGGLYDDYITYLGSYAFIQDPASTNFISADRDHIALTNQEGSTGGANSIYGVYCGLLRGAKRMVATITDTTTGEVIWSKTAYNQRKSYNGGGSIYPSNYEIDFHVRDYDLKNNAKYEFTLTGYLDYANDENGTTGNNLSSTFSFPFYIDFTAPIITDVTYTYEFDSDAKKNRLFANISIFDNHYVEGFVPGYIYTMSSGYGLQPFQRYVVPVSGTRNSTNVVQFELTDYLDDIRENSYTKNTFIIQAYDYAQNTSTFEIEIPDDVRNISFKEMETEEGGKEPGVTISVNQTYELDPVVLPGEDSAWKESINYTVKGGGSDVVRVVGNKIVGVSSGTATVVATSNRNPSVTAELTVRVVGKGEEGYQYFDTPVAESFRLTGYEVLKVFYRISSDDRDLGTDEAGRTVMFRGTGVQTLKMFPSESVRLQHELVGYFDSDRYQIEYTSSNPLIAEVTPDGVITAKNVDERGNALNSERSTTITVRVKLYNEQTGEFEQTPYSQPVLITVKEAYTTNGPYLMSYYGLGDTVTVPTSFGSTEIYQFAFSNYRYIPKDLSAGDVIDKEDPYSSKPWYIGDDTIKEVILPEGIEIIDQYAFAGLTALTKISLPSTLKKIQNGAFRDCTALTTVEFPRGNNLQFVNQYAFYNCRNLTTMTFDSIVAIGDYAFAGERTGYGTSIPALDLPATAQSLGAHAFENSRLLNKVTMKASAVKFGEGTFLGCAGIREMSVNASVLPAGLFEGCTALTTLTVGPDVEVIGQNAFRGTKVSTFRLAEGSGFQLAANGKIILSADGTTLVHVAPDLVTCDTLGEAVTTIGTGAFSSAEQLTTVTLPSVTTIPDYAFAECAGLKTVRFGALTSVGKGAFSGTQLTTLPMLAEGGQGVEIGDRAFYNTHITAVSLPANAKVGEYAFAANVDSGTNRTTSSREGSYLTSVTAEDGAELGVGAFYGNYNLAKVEIKDDVKIGDGAFAAAGIRNVSGYYVDLGNMYVNLNGQLTVMNIFANMPVSSITSLTIGENAEIGDSAFLGIGSGKRTAGSTGIQYGNTLTSLSLGTGAKIGSNAFAGASNLTSVDLSGVSSVGSNAFGLTSADAYIRYLGMYVLVGTVSVSGANFETIDLSSAKDEIAADGTVIRPAVGENAFRFEKLSESSTSALTSVKLGADVTVIGDGAFYGSENLAEVTLGGQIKEVGAEAFYGCKKLAAFTVADGAEIGARAFYGCEALGNIGLEKVTEIGDSAFVGTALTAANIPAVTSLGSFAFANSAVTSVTLGDGLAYVGENPFVRCAIPAFTGGADASLSTYDIGDNGIKVIEGVLYRTAGNGGLELVCYPLGKEGTAFTVAEHTIRITAQAFAGSGLVTVTLDREVAAIGDRAFYGCDGLSVVEFNSIEAPILEEQYRGTDSELVYTDDDYIDDNVGFNPGGSGLGIVNFKLWNAGPANTLYGGNFVASVGDTEGIETHSRKTLVMIRPYNGNGYETWLFSRYFDKVIEGMTAASDETVDLIGKIVSLPATQNITLDDEAFITGLLAAYDALTTDQQALVQNYRDGSNYYQILLSASRVIDYLKQQQQPTDPTPSTPGGEEPGEPDRLGLILGIIGLSLGVLAIAAAAFALFFVLRPKRKKAAAGSETSQTAGPEGAENSEKPVEKKDE